ncbi:MAG: hypothetical protein BroJett040_21790 [Oligoflexia bacterium]|nr:MAG: hypothetical protein BroJett040_21790 [Oligoflexia bacterium]
MNTSSKKNLHLSRYFVLMVTTSLMLLTSCTKKNQFQTIEQPSLAAPPAEPPFSDETSQNETTPDPVDEAPITSVPVTPVYKMEALSWESPKRPDAVNWSTHAFQVVDKEVFDKLDKASDADFFCPKYKWLERNQRVNFWGQLFSAVSYYESGYDPTSRMQETTMGSDPITGKPVYSEGLLQLSYQDIQWAPYCEFDWSKDKNLSPTDPKKTILSPYKNLSCGIKIMARQIASKGSIILRSGVYWAVLKDGGRYEKIDEIAAITKRLSFCN